MVLVGEWSSEERFAWVVLVGGSRGWVVVVVGGFGKWFDGWLVLVGGFGLVGSLGCNFQFFNFSIFQF